jgi:hypothetical protein
MGRKSASGSGIRYEQLGSYFLELRNHFFGVKIYKILKFFAADPGSEMETVRIRDPEKKDPGSGSRGQKSTRSWIQIRNVDPNIPTPSSS